MRTKWEKGNGKKDGREKGNGKKDARGKGNDKI
jgi:hypothetical protein